MQFKFRFHRRLLVTLGMAIAASSAKAETVALWLFDEQVGVYPSALLNDAGPDSLFMILGRGGEIVPGRFGQALRIVPPGDFRPDFDPDALAFKEVVQETPEQTGLVRLPPPPGRTVEPLNWYNATFAAAFISGKSESRRAAFANATDSRLNLGAHDWTIEFWLKLDRAPDGESVIWEIGEGPRGENERVTRLALDASGAFTFFNAPSKARVQLPTDIARLRAAWTHCAFVYSAARGELTQFLNGRPHGVPARLSPQALGQGDESYVSLGRDGTWRRPLPGALDEVRISNHAVYSAPFTPRSFSRLHDGTRPAFQPVAGAPLLFGSRTAAPLDLGSRRHLFLDGALFASQRNITFAVHPVRVAEAVLRGGGWISVVEDEDGLIRLYADGPDSTLAVHISSDGIHFTAPDLGREFKGHRNVVVTDTASAGTVFRDPNGPPDERWKLVSGLRDRGGVFVYTSADGYSWRRHETTALPFWAGSAVNVFYDDQRQRYVVHNRSDYFRTPGGAHDRKSVFLEVSDLLAPWPFQPVAAGSADAELRRSSRAGELDPWWVTHGPLAPGRIGREYPVAFAADPAIDPPATDVYNTRAQKYPWAEDAYVAFPLMFFHYHHDGPPQRQILSNPELGRGTGLLESQLAVSRDGVNWHRYPRPAYLGMGEVNGYPMKRSYIGHGMIRRGREIWQYSYSRSSYHDGYGRDVQPAVVHRLVQRVDGFVSADAPYEGGEFTTRPLRFSGNRLVLNIDTDATGFAQVGLLDEHGQPIPGFAVDDCVYINGDETDYEVQWLPAGGSRTSDLSPLAGRIVQVVVRMRGSSLYALQFIKR